MGNEQILHFEKLLHEFIEPTFKIVEIDISQLLEEGENYGGELLKIKITVSKNGNTVILHAIGKRIHPVESVQKYYNVQVTFKNEIAFYKEVIPALQGFQRQQNVNDVIDCFPKYLAKGKLYTTFAFTVFSQGLPRLELGKC